MLYTSFLVLLCLAFDSLTSALPNGRLEQRQASSSSSTKSVTTLSSVASSTLSSSKASTSTATSTKVADGACTNSAISRQCWTQGYSIAADFDTKSPNTGKTRYYDLTFSNSTLNPDGSGDVIAFKINDKFLGPTIYADWGDTIQVTVHNNLADNGTGIHWHGIRQLNTNTEDGVPGITECPLAPGDTKVYTFRATQYGTTWYHSHWAVQYGCGILGAMVINGPATANYDIDLGPLMIMDWYTTPAPTLAYISVHTLGAPPQAANALINGTGVSNSGTGSYYRTTITKNKKYRIRIINMSVDAHYMVSLDSHRFNVITTDFVPIKPYQADWIFVGIGQRYDVIIQANQTSGNYWFRAEGQAGCSNILTGGGKSIFTYADATPGIPSSSATSYTGRCTDETGMTPYWDSFVPSGPLTTTELGVAIQAGVNSDGSQIVTWGINFTALSVQWEEPILEYVINGNFSFLPSENLIELPTAGQWYYWVIQEVPGTPISINVDHPIHLHGHDFFVLGQGTGNYATDVDPSTLNYDNPTRRDVAMLPANGWMVMAFQTDNPGAWLMHCHIAWHADEGLAVQFLESKDKIPGISPPSTDWTETCTNWDAYYPSKSYYHRYEGDSGI